MPLIEVLYIPCDINVARYVRYLDEKRKLDFSKPFTKRFMDDPWYTGVSDD